MWEYVSKIFVKLISILFISLVHVLFTLSSPQSAQGSGTISTPYLVFGPRPRHGRVVKTPFRGAGRRFVPDTPKPV